MATLTFDPKRREARPPGPQRHGGITRLQPRINDQGLTLRDSRLSGASAQRRVKKWLSEGQDVLGRRICGVVCQELHKSGEVHYHSLLGVDGGLQLGDVRELSRLWFARNGYNRLEIPKSVRDCAAYAAKYMTKEIDQGGVLFWPETGLLKAAEGQQRLRNH